MGWRVLEVALGMGRVREVVGAGVSRLGVVERGRGGSKGRVLGSVRRPVGGRFAHDGRDGVGGRSGELPLTGGDLVLLIVVAVRGKVRRARLEVVGGRRVEGFGVALSVDMEGGERSRVGVILAILKRGGRRRGPLPLVDCFVPAPARRRPLARRSLVRGVRARQALLGQGRRGEVDEGGVATAPRRTRSRCRQVERARLRSRLLQPLETRATVGDPRVLLPRPRRCVLLTLCPN